MTTMNSKPLTSSPRFDDLNSARSRPYDLCIIQSPALLHCEILSSFGLDWRICWVPYRFGTHGKAVGQRGVFGEVDLVVEDVGC